jgi:hypothetical protein
VALPPQPTPAVDDLTEASTRTLLHREDGRRDETSDVRWRQGPTWYVDLRQRAGAPDLHGVMVLERDVSAFTRGSASACV